MIGLFLWWMSCALTVAASAYLLLALAAVAMHRHNNGPGWVIAPRVTLLKPLCGYEPGLELALESFFSQRTNFPVRFIFGVTHAEDAALQVCREVASRFPNCRVEFIVSDEVRGHNPKVSNLINMARAGLDQIIVISDSDTIIAPGTLQAAIDALAAPEVGAVTTLYRTHPAVAADPVHCFGAWNLDYWDLPMQVLYARLAPPSVTYGPLTAIRGEVLTEIGGLGVLADRLCDDAALGQLVRTAGYKVAFTPAIAETLVNDASFRELFRHELRWARTVRGLEPFGYSASVVTHPGPIPLLLLLYPGLPAITMVILPVFLRWLLMRLVMKRFGSSAGLATPGMLGLWLRDCASLSVWVTGFFVGQVHWRGRAITLLRRDTIGPQINMYEQPA